MMFEFLLLHGDREKNSVWFSCFLLVLFLSTTGDPRFYRAFLYASFGQPQPWAGAYSVGCIHV